MEQQGLEMFGVEIEKKKEEVKDITHQIYENADVEFKREHKIDFCCPNCKKGRLMPLKKKDSEHFAICDNCGNGYNTNYNPPEIYFTAKQNKIKPIKKRKGIIEIDYCEFDDNSEPHLTKWKEKHIPLPKIKGFSVDFDGFNEGSASPCKDKKEADEQVKYLLEHHKEKYDIKVIDKRIKENLFELKPLIKIERRSDKSHLVSVDGCLGLHSEDKEGKEKEEIEKCKKYLIEKGFKDNEIKIEEHTYTYQDDKPEFIEKKIKELSEELKKYLAKKYGFDVKIIVEKGVKENER